MGFQSYGTFTPQGEGRGSNRFSDLYVDDLWLSDELRLQDKAAILSNNFVSGSTGFKISYDGSVELNDVTIRGTLEASLFRTASSGTRLEIDGSAGDTFISFYDGAGPTLVGMIGWEPTGYGADTLTISTETNLDPIVISAAGYIHLTAPGDGGNSVRISGDGDGAIPGVVLRVENEAQTTTHFAVMTNSQVRVGDGSAATPGLSFLGDTNTGLYNGGSDIIAFATAGSLAWSMNSAGTFYGNGIVLAGFGSVSLPAHGFLSDQDTGMYRPTTNTVSFACGGGQAMQIQQNQVKFKDGSAASPSLTFINDTNTGMYRVTTDKIGFSTAGINRVSISAAGLEANGGIVKTTQYRSLTGDGTAYFGTHNGSYWGTQLYLQGNNGTLGKYLRLFMGPGTGNGTTLYERFRIDYNGRMFLSQDGTTSAIETNRYISQQAEAFRFVTASGYIDIGSQNTGYAHIYSDRDRFAFNQGHTETNYETIATGDYGRYTDQISGGIYNIGAVTSGARFKKNIKAASARNPRALLDTPMREWDWDEEETEVVLGRRHSGKGRGLVADELLLAEPALVALDDAGVPLTIKDGKPMQDMIIETLQHLDARLTALEEQL